MSSLVNSLKSEIARVARKELKTELLALRKAATAHRSEIAALKRQVKTLVSEVKANARASSKRAESPAAADEAEAAPRVRFSAERFAAWRTKVGITQAQTAKLVEASALSVFKWESGKARPRNAQLHKIAAVMKKGKREIKKSLEE